MKAGISWIWMCCLLVVTMDCLPIDPQDADYATLTVSSCLTDINRTLDLDMNCSGGQMVRMIRIFYGHSRSGSCRQTDIKDCTMDLPNTDYPCVGSDTCIISLSVTELHAGREIPRCKLPSTYIQADYQCIPEPANIDICDQSLVVAQKGFLQTPKYPITYPDNISCNFTISAPYDEQKIRLFIIDLDLEPNGTACLDWVQFFDGYHSQTMCGQRARQLLRPSTHRFFHIHFYSDAATRRKRKGLWLYFEVYPYVRLTTAMATTTRLTTTTLSDVDCSNESLCTTTTISSGKALQLQSSEPQISVGLIIGVAVSSFVCIVVVLVVVITFKRFQVPRRYGPATYSSPPDAETIANPPGGTPKNNLKAMAVRSGIRTQHPSDDVMYNQPLPLYNPQQSVAVDTGDKLFLDESHNSSNG